MNTTIQDQRFPTLETLTGENEIIYLLITKTTFKFIIPFVKANCVIQRSILPVRESNYLKRS